MTMQQNQQIQQPHGDGARLATLETRVTSIEAGITSIVQKLDARSAINWAPIGILVTVLTVIGGMALNYMSGTQARLETMITKIEARSDHYLTKGEFDARLTVAGQRRDDAQRMSDGRMDRIERDADALAKAIVPRGEHEEKWASQRQRDADLQRQLDAVRKDVSDLYSPKDAISTLQRRIEELEHYKRRS